MTRATITNSIATDLANNSNILPSELRGVLTAHLNESDLRTENGATIATRADLITATWPTVGQIITTLGHAAVGDGGGADWKIVANGTVATPDGYTTIALTGTTLQAQLLPGPEKTYDVRSVGIFASTGGSNNRLAMLALWAYVKTQGGVTIYIGTNMNSHNIEFSTVTEPNYITIRMQAGRKIIPTNPVVGTYVWRFLDPNADSGTDGTTSVDLINVKMETAFTNTDDINGATRLQCNGIRIGATNNLRLVDCRVQGIRGIGVRLDRVYNAQVEITTFGCGEPGATPLPAVLICGASVGGVTNDVAIKGASERDVLGWWIEDSVLIRKGSTIKLHGTTYTTNALTVFRCNDFDLEVVCSEDWTTDGFIRICDGSNSMGITSLSGYGGNRQTTRGELKVRLFHNRSFRRAAASGLGKYIMVNLPQTTSQFRINGEGLPHATEWETDTAFSDHYDLHISSDTLGYIDYSELWLPNVAYDKRVLDERNALQRANKSYAGAKRAADWTTINDALVSGVLNTQRLRGFTYSPGTAQTITGINTTYMDIGPSNACEVRMGNGNTSITASANLKVNGATSGTTALPSGSTMIIKRWTENLFYVRWEA